MLGWQQLNFSKVLLLASGLMVLSSIQATDCSALPISSSSINDSTSIRENFMLGDVDSRSYDGQGFDVFQPFESFASGDLLSVGPFTGGPLGSTLELTVVSAVGGYSSGLMGVSSEFGFLNEQDEFSAVFDFETDVLGSSAMYEQGSDEELTFAVQTPQALISSVDEENIGGTAHVLGASIVSDGVVTIDNADLFGNSISFDVQVGDLVLFVEDLIASGNSIDFVPDRSDFDYNDLVILVRATDNVPEPGTLVLFFGAAGAGILRKRRNSQQG